MGRKLKDWEKEQEERDKQIEEGVKRLFTRWMVKSCRTSALAILAFATYLGSWILDHSERVYNALNALFGNGK